ncbi:hypothetical protein [Actinoallomurus acaciae]|uniref:HTH araC/xylS-type domain-containing protein n=1 Tax=Actinoallomurus acaciae TaxID=502577 RepID=A0ABV5YK62_9ACTN
MDPGDRRQYGSRRAPRRRAGCAWAAPKKITVSTGSADVGFAASMTASTQARAEQFDGTLAPLLEWVTARLGEPVTTDLAAHAGVSVRTLSRRFADQPRRGRPRSPDRRRASG